MRKAGGIIALIAGSLSFLSTVTSFLYPIFPNERVAEVFALFLGGLALHFTIAALGFVALSSPRRRIGVAIIFLAGLAGFLREVSIFQAGFWVLAIQGGIMILIAPWYHRQYARLVAGLRSSRRRTI